MTEDERQMVKRTHDFWFVPAHPGRKTRAEQMDDLLTAVNTGKLTVRAGLWLAGVIAASTAAWAQVKGFWK